MLTTLPRHHIVLLGAGHTNAHVLRMWRMGPLADCRLTLVSNFPEATYSGMLPGTLAGLYPPGRMQIDLVRLSAAAGARFIQAEVSGLDLQARRLQIVGRPAIEFDVLSIGIGSMPRRDGVQIAGDSVLPIKPMQTFVERLDRRLAELRESVAGRPLRIAIVGGGAGGVEIAFCLPSHLRQSGNGSTQLSLIDAGDRLVPGLPQRTADLARRTLEARSIRVLLGQSVRSVGNGSLSLADGSQEPADLVLWATGARPPDSLALLGLPTDKEGFLLTRRTLQTVADVPIFVVGDAGTIEGRPTPKAGVYAVRQGPVLWENIGRLVRGEPLVEYEPQPGFLSLLATGDGRAILSYKGLTFQGAWCWRLKDYIDGRFMDKYQDYSLMPMAPPPAENSRSQMRCAGCGGKVGGSVLSRALARLDIPPSEHVLLGLEAPDDAAVVQPPGGRPIVATADFFTAFMDDPYLVGRVAALNAASDLFAMGSQPLAALALATIPVGPAREQEQLLYELLAGGLEEFRRMGATLVGGHTIEGPQITIGYTMLADAGAGRVRAKGGLRPGDVLVLTKPLGSGILLAAHMQARLKAAWFQPLIETLLASNQPAAALCDEFDIQGMTDVTGFGLAGHLLEMLLASGLACDLRLSAVPLLPGAEELIGEGIESTLAPANRVHEAQIEAAIAQQRTPQYAALFDPQTSGGLLMGVPERHLEAVLQRLVQINALPAAPIANVISPTAKTRRLRVR